MPEFSKQSMKKLNTCNSSLIYLFTEVVKEFDCTVICGNRNKKEQNRAFNDGFSMVEFPFSKHNSIPSDAVDVVPYPIDWEDIERFEHFGFFTLGVAVGLGLKITWGGDFSKNYYINDEKFIDLPHYQIVII